MAAFTSGNKFLVEDRATRIFLDFGMQMGKVNLFFGEFLQPKPQWHGRPIQVIKTIGSQVDEMYSNLDPGFHPRAYTL